MSVQVTPEPGHGSGRYETMRSALDSNPRTLRFCVMDIVARVAPVVIAVLMRHILLRDSVR
jgi:hypothetical protein